MPKCFHNISSVAQVMFSQNSSPCFPKKIMDANYFFQLSQKRKILRG